jgi:hypothetical protein
LHVSNVSALVLYSVCIGGAIIIDEPNLLVMALYRASTNISNKGKAIVIDEYLKELDLPLEQNVGVSINLM